jgi:ABC-type thiamin/hydroxymethylpyrimidine transport system permease subunit
MVKKDSFITGIIAGLLAPLLSFAIYKYIKFGSIPFGDIFRLMKENTSLISGSIIISLLGNLVLLTFFLNKKFDKSAKGIFAVTCLYALASLAVKYLA